MTRRYSFLHKTRVYSALNKLRASFLAAKNGSEVNEIINGILTHDEQMRIGRRIEVAQMLISGYTWREIVGSLKVGLSTIELVEKLISDHPMAYKLINKREKKVEKEFDQKAYIRRNTQPGPKRKTIYTGFTRKEVKR